MGACEPGPIRLTAAGTRGRVLFVTGWAWAGSGPAGAAAGVVFCLAAAPMAGAGVLERGNRPFTLNRRAAGVPGLCVCD